MFSDQQIFLLFVIDLIPIPLIVYSAYRAFNIRRALAVPLYRSQALGVVLVGLSIIGFAFTFNLYNSLNLNSNFYSFFEVLIGFAIPPFVTFYWIDASMRTARKSDPLLRDVLHWRIVRKILWIWFGGIFLIFVDVITVTFAEEIQQGQLNSTTSSPGAVTFVLFLSPLFIVPIVGLVFLPRAAKMSGDKRLGKHLRWFGLYIFFVLGAFAAVLIPNPSGFLGSLLFQLEVAIPQIVGGLCLYKSVRWLVPLNLIEPVTDAKEA